MNRIRKDSQWGVTLAVSLIVVIIVFLGLTHLSVIGSNIKMLIDTLQPIIIGLVLGYLVSPVEERLQRFYEGKKIKKNLAKTISIFTILIVMIVMIVIALKLIIPQLITTILDLSVSLPSMVRAYVYKINNYAQKDSQLLVFVNEGTKRFLEWFNAWMNNGMVDTMQQLVDRLLDVFGFVVNIIIGIVVMVYVLYEKDHFRGQSKKILYAVSKNRVVNGFILDTVRQCDKMFGGFITGKVIDSIIIGVLAFVGLVVLKMPYASLIAFIIGCTNIIPFFGPYVGAVPSAMLIFLVSPVKCLWFIAFVIVLQQLDGNIIGPRILGSSTGLSPFWILVSILLFGKLFGVVGMIIGVPAFATLYYVAKRLVEAALYKQDLPAETDEYINIDKIYSDNQATYLKSVRKKKSKSKPKE
ncbi:MAG: AI-2E family transporter [Lachnospiraceae bacterium]|nr:AI-2E family transporter [Lachnospiraceae bacterium]